MGPFVENYFYELRNAYCANKNIVYRNNTTKKTVFIFDAYAFSQSHAENADTVLEASAMHWLQHKNAERGKHRGE